jgi:hypothetical protein
LVRAIAAELAKEGYAIAPSDWPRGKSPIATGDYDADKTPDFLVAIEKYKADHGMATDPSLTYPLVEALLGVDLFERWSY